MPEGLHYLVHVFGFVVEHFAFPVSEGVEVNFLYAGLRSLWTLRGRSRLGTVLFRRARTLL